MSSEYAIAYSARTMGISIARAREADRFLTGRAPVTEAEYLDALATQTGVPRASLPKTSAERVERSRRLRAECQLRVNAVVAEFRAPPITTADREVMKAFGTDEAKFLAAKRDLAGAAPPGAPSVVAVTGDVQITAEDRIVMRLSGASESSFLAAKLALKAQG